MHINYAVELLFVLDVFGWLNAKMQNSIKSRLEKKRRPPTFSPLIKYENVNFRLKKVTRCKAKKVNNLNDIEEG